MKDPLVSHTRRLFLVIAFDGSGYHGWQAGRSGRGVADVVQRLLAEELGLTEDVVSSSRTDSGVHAYGLVAHADVMDKHARKPADVVRALLNSKLPADIRIRDAMWVPDSVHARFDAKWKEYRYVIWNDPVMNPLRNGQAWHVAKPLDLDAMKQAACHLLGTHDFRAFTSRRDGVLGSSEREMMKLSVSRKGCEVTITLRADGFLYKMCRGIAGTLVHVGHGKMTAEEAGKLLDNGADRTPGVNAPAHGLVLWSVGYPRGVAALKTP
jgi:tRNA pseudouridine38-40 synthase